MKKQIKIGIIGLGRIGKVHAQGYAKLVDCIPDVPVVPEIYALLRTRLHANQDFVKSIGSPLVTRDPQEFFRQPLDAVDICTPNYLHREQALRAIAQGMHVYCEKPLANNLQEAREMAAAARQSGVLNHTAFSFRYLPAVKLIKQALKAKLIGSITHFHIRYYHSSYLNPQKPMSWRLKLDQSGGGALADLGIHTIDLVHYLIGQPLWVQAEARTYVHKRTSAGRLTGKDKVDVDDWGIILLGFENDTRGYIETSRVAAGKERGFELSIFGKKGGLFMDLSQPYKAHHFNFFKDKWQDLTELAPSSQKEQQMAKIFACGLPFGEDLHMACILDFLYSLYLGKQSDVGFAVAVAAQEVLEAAYRSSQHDGARIPLPLK